MGRGSPFLLSGTITDMTLTEFITAYTGKSVLYNLKDPSLTGHCVQLACFYTSQVLGKPVIWADAAKWFTNKDTDYLRVPYTPGLVPPVGSLVIWNSSLPNSGGAGHIAIMVNGDPNSFTSFDSNWNGKTAKLVTHDYAYVAGWLLPAGGKGSGALTQGESMPTLTDAELKDFQGWKEKGMYYETKLIPAMQADKVQWVKNFNIIQAEKEALQTELDKLKNLDTSKLEPSEASLLTKLFAWFIKN